MVTRLRRIASDMRSAPSPPTAERRGLAADYDGRDERHHLIYQTQVEHRAQQRAAALDQNAGYLPTPQLVEERVQVDPAVGSGASEYLGVDPLQTSET